MWPRSFLSFWNKDTKLILLYIGNCRQPEKKFNKQHISAKNYWRLSPNLKKKILKMITYKYADVILCWRLSVPKVKFFSRVRNHEKNLSVNSGAFKVSFKNFQGTLITYSVVIDSYQVPRAAEVRPLLAITFVYLMFVFLQLSFSNN